MEAAPTAARELCCLPSAWDGNVDGNRECVPVPPPLVGSQQQVGLGSGAGVEAFPLLPCPADGGERLEIRKLPPPLLACYPWPGVTVISHQ